MESKNVEGKIKYYKNNNNRDNDNIGWIINISKDDKSDKRWDTNAIQHYKIKQSTIKQYWTIKVNWRKHQQHKSVYMYSNAACLLLEKFVWHAFNKIQKKMIGMDCTYDDYHQNTACKYEYDTYS